MTPFLIAPSILSADFGHLADQIHTAEDSGADWIHIDVMDGHFVPNITMGPFIVEACRKTTSLPLDVHLMIEKPELHVQNFRSAGADWISVHLEGNPHLHRTLQVIRQLGAKAGIALNPGTPANALEALAPFLDYVLVMTVNPGYSGQVFIPECVRKIAQIQALLTSIHSTAIIEVDGGVSQENIGALAKAGARCFVAATSIFKYPSGIQAGITALRSALE